MNTIEATCVSRDRFVPGQDAAMAVLQYLRYSCSKEKEEEKKNAEIVRIGMEDATMRYACKQKSHGREDGEEKDRIKARSRVEQSRA